MLYPILNLRSLNITPKQYVKILEQSVISTLSQFNIPSITTNNPGAWIDQTTKIASVGVKVIHAATLHGLALNCNTDLSYFDHITPCNLENTTVTSISRVLKAHITPDDIAPSLTQNLIKYLTET